MVVATRQISALSLADPISRAGDLLLLYAILDRAKTVSFPKSATGIAPVVQTRKEAFEMTNFHPSLAGRWMNYYKKLGGIRHPAKKGTFSIEINGETADFSFEISPVGSIEFASLCILISTVNRRDCRDLILNHERSITPFYRRMPKDLAAYWNRIAAKRANES